MFFFYPTFKEYLYITEVEDRTINRNISPQNKIITKFKLFTKELNSVVYKITICNTMRSTLKTQRCQALELNFLSELSIKGHCSMT